MNAENQPQNQEFTPIGEVISTFKISRPSIDRKIRLGILSKYKQPGCNRVFLDKSEVAKMFKPQRV